MYQTAGPPMMPQLGRVSASNFLQIPVFSQLPRYPINLMCQNLYIMVMLLIYQHKIFALNYLFDSYKELVNALGMPPLTGMMKARYLNLLL